MNLDSQPLMIFQSKLRTLRLLLMSVGLMMASWLALTLDSPLRNPEVVSVFMSLVGIVGLLFFGGCCAFFILKIFSQKPLLVISTDGIVDNASGVRIGFIPWSEIEGIQIIRVAKQRFLSIAVVHPGRFRQRSILRRSFIDINERFGWGTANIPESIMPISLETVKSEIDARSSRG